MAVVQTRKRQHIVLDMLAFWVSRSCERCGLVGCRTLGQCVGAVLLDHLVVNAQQEKRRDPLADEQREVIDPSSCTHSALHFQVILYTHAYSPVGAEGT